MPVSTKYLVPLRVIPSAFTERGSLCRDGLRGPDLLNYVPAIAYHVRLNLPATFTQPGDRLLD